MNLIPHRKTMPRGHKIPQAELEARIRWITDLLVEGVPRSAIISRCTERYGCGASTVERYIKGATRRLSECYKPQAESAAELARRRFEKIFSAAMQKGDLRTAMTAQSNLCKLEGSWKAAESGAPSIIDALTSLMKSVREQEVAS